MKFKRFFALSLGLTAASFLLRDLSAAQYTWTEPSIIDTSLENLYWQVGSTMTLDNDDNLLVAWDDVFVDGSTAGDTLVLEISTDTGETWSRRVIEGGIHSMIGETRVAQDMIVDLSDNIWVLWSFYPNLNFDPLLHLSKSTDNGSTFSTVLVEQQGSFDFLPQLAVSQDNSIYMLWNAEQLTLTRLRSGDIAQRFDTVVPIDTFLVSPFVSIAVTDDYTAYAIWSGVTVGMPSGFREFVFCSVSTDSGNSFQYTTRIDTIEVLDGDNSSQREPKASLDSQGNLFVVYTKVPELNRTDVMIAQSSNRGLSFSDPIRINDPSSNHTNPTVAVDSQDGVNVAWGSSSGIQFSRSTDGGVLFSPSDSLGGGAPPDLAISSAGIAYVTYDRFLVFFTKATIIVSVEDTETQFTPTLHQNYPNPFNASTTIRFELNGTSRVVIEVYDLLGRRVQTIMDEQLQAGSHEVDWTPRSFASGVYVATIRSSSDLNESFRQSKKMILLK